MTLAIAACSGGSVISVGRATGPSVAKNAVADTARFCTDYAAAATAYVETQGDVTDPSFDRFLTLLAKARAEAPSAIRSQVAAMYDEAARARSTNGSGDLTSYSQAISDWATSHCTGSGGGVTSSSVGAAPTAGASTFCAAATPILSNLTTLNDGGVQGTTSAAQWQQADTAVHALVALAPATPVGNSTVRQDAATVATDLDDIVANGYDNGNGGANLQQDVGVLGGDATRVGCAPN